MKYARLLRPAQWRTRAAVSGVLVGIGVALISAARNDHWSATVGLALGQLAIGAGAWGIARPLLSAGLVALGGRQRLALLPSLLMTAYTLLVVTFAGGTPFERTLLVAYLTLPGPLLDALLTWYEGQPQPRHIKPQQEHPNDHHRP